MINSQVAIIHKNHHYAKILQIAIDYFKYFAGSVIFTDLNAMSEYADAHFVAALVSVDFFTEDFEWISGKPDFPIIAIVDDGNNEGVRLAINAGVADCVYFSSEPEVYFRILKNSVDGLPSVSGAFFQNPQAVQKPANGQHLFAALSRRENEIVQWLAKGKLYKEIADELDISIETVKRHCTNLYRKLGVSNRSETIAKFYGKEEN